MPCGLIVYEFIMSQPNSMPNTKGKSSQSDVRGNHCPRKVAWSLKIWINVFTWHKKCPCGCKLPADNTSCSAWCVTLMRGCCLAGVSFRPIMFTAKYLMKTQKFINNPKKNQVRSLVAWLLFAFWCKPRVNKCTNRGSLSRKSLGAEGNKAIWPRHRRLNPLNGTF